MPVLDATLRDGGLKVGFSWSPLFAKNYISAMRLFPEVEWIEVGYLNSGTKFFSPFYGLDADFLSEICSESSAKMAAMIDYHYRPTDFHFGGVADFLGLVRVTSRRGDLAEAVRYTRLVASATGAKVSLNLSNASNYVKEDWKYLLGQDLSDIDYVYIADTHGSFNLERTQDEMSWLVGSLLEHEVIPGIHLHDHSGLATRNFLIANSLGFEILDGTLCGLGKGGGNLPLEQLMSARELSKVWPLLYREVDDSYIRQKILYQVTALFSVVDHYADQFFLLDEDFELFFDFCSELSRAKRDEFESGLLLDLISRSNAKQTL